MSMPASASLRTSEEPRAAFSGLALDVRRGLLRAGQKRLSPQYLYDEVGSALFDAITFLDEYGLTRADARLLAKYSGRIWEKARRPSLIVEMGSGSGRKTAHLLAAAVHRASDVRYFAIDISGEALARCVRELAPICPVTPIRGRFLEGVRQALAQRAGRRPALAILLGSTIGNFDHEEAAEFLPALRNELAPGDSLLIGADLIKDPGVLLRAYDDAAGVTSAFNLNLLARLNRELGANFDLKRWRHRARYDAAAKRMEMHVESLADQTVSIPGAGCAVHFDRGETIWTESSHKYTPSDLDRLALENGFHPVECWIDSEWPFAECLWRRDDAVGIGKKKSLSAAEKRTNGSSGRTAHLGNSRY
jgi:L-histidine N-alpha-methyltransferase